MAPSMSSESTVKEPDISWLTAALATARIMNAKIQAPIPTAAKTIAAMFKLRRVFKSLSMISLSWIRAQGATLAAPRLGNHILAGLLTEA